MFGDVSETSQSIDPPFTYVPWWNVRNPADTGFPGVMLSLIHLMPEPIVRAMDTVPTIASRHKSMPRFAHLYAGIINR